MFIHLIPLSSKIPVLNEDCFNLLILSNLVFKHSPAIIGAQLSHTFLLFRHKWPYRRKTEITAWYFLYLALAGGQNRVDPPTSLWTKLGLDNMLATHDNFWLDFSHLIARRNLNKIHTFIMKVSSRRLLSDLLNYCISHEQKHFSISGIPCY